MAEFTPETVNLVLKHEGLFSNDPVDPGGATKYGVSLRYLKAHGLDLNHDGIIDINDIMGMSVEEATEIYRVAWDRTNFSQINEQKLATKMFDIAVNIGTCRAVALLQRAALIHQVDGKLGNDTLRVVNTSQTDSLYMQLEKEQALYYQKLVTVKPVLGKYLEGWLNRAYDRA
jgi:lysozyme family protein